MTYGWGFLTDRRGCRPWPVLVFCWLSCWLTFAAWPAHARPAPASELTVTLLSVGPGVLQAQGADGRARTIRLTPATWVLQRGLVVSANALMPGTALRVRLGHSSRGAALLVCDAETADALAARRRRPLTGTVVSVGDTVWTVQPADSPVPLPVCLSAHTTFRAGGSPVAASAFGAGAQVTITTRGLANGLLAAVSVSDSLSDSGSGAAPDAPGSAADVTRPIWVSGVLVETRPDLGLLTLQDAAGTARTVAVNAGTRIRSGGRAASLGELQPGIRVRVRLGAGQDAAGNPVAAGVSASAARPAGKRK